MKKLSDILDISPDLTLETLQRARMAALTLIKWLLCSLFTGSFIGLIGALFYKALQYVTSFRIQHPYTLFFLPAAGIIIVLMYHFTHEDKNTGTNLVITAIQSNAEVPVRVAPLIIISTLLTHLCGGSAGREGAALQVGGSLSNFIAKILHFDDKDTRIMIMCGMSACFSALFGTPIAAAIFSMEVMGRGGYVLRRTCSSYYIRTCFRRSWLFNITPTMFIISEICELSISTGIRFMIMSVIFALASIVFVICFIHQPKYILEYLSNPYIRIIIAGVLVIILRYITGTTDYLGAGAPMIAASFITSCSWYVFILKMLFTAITLGGGFKGGEIVPTLFVGATLGSFLAPVFGLPIGLCAACGMVSVFCGVTNCPLTNFFILSIEMFGAGSMKL